MKVVALVLLISGFALGQKTGDEMDSRHRRALANYLKSRPTLSMRFETILSDEYLSFIRTSFGQSVKPNYVVADFNNDRVKDFAVLLQENDLRSQLPSQSDNAEGDEHEPDFPIQIVVFNGSRNGRFTFALCHRISGPRASFINFDKFLYFGVFESDANTFLLRPRGKSYVVRYPRSALVFPRSHPYDSMKYFVPSLDT